MKCDELKSLKNIGLSFDTTTLHKQVIAEDSEGKCYGFDSWEEIYLKSDVDAAIAELKAENAELKKKCEAEKSIGATFSKNGADLARWVEELRKEIESLKASHYAEMVDAGMRERRLRRALYKACANWADVVAFEETEGIGHDNSVAERWRKMERKCLNKMEEYK